MKKLIPLFIIIILGCQKQSQHHNFSHFDSPPIEQFLRYPALGHKPCTICIKGAFRSKCLIDCRCTKGCGDKHETCSCGYSEDWRWCENQVY